MPSARSLKRPAPAQERAIVAGLLAGSFVAVVALLGARVGLLATLLGIPAGLLAARMSARLHARQEGLRLLSQQDPLTGLGNRRLLQERLSYEIMRHRRMSRRFSVLALDLDGFKAVNDRYGHPAGDEILREIAKALLGSVRDQDTVVRAGGDEFCVLVPESSWKEAERLAARMCEAVTNAVGGLDVLGVSVGYAIFPDEGWTPEHLLGRADAAALEAKRKRREQRHSGGRDRRAA